MPSASERADEIFTVLETIAQRINHSARAAFQGPYQFHFGDGVDFHLFEDATGVKLAGGVSAAPASTITIEPNLFIDLYDQKENPRAADFKWRGRLQLSGPMSTLELLFNCMKDQQPLEQRYRAAEDAVRARRVYQVERVEAPSAEIVQQAMAAFQPLLITGAMKSWRSLSWNLENMKATYGALPLNASVGATTFGSVITQIERGDHVSTNCLLPEALAPEAGAPSYFPWEQISEPSVWIGSRGHVTMLHRDLRAGFSAQIFGTKRWTLYSPDQAPLVYPAALGRAFQNCNVDPGQPDFEAYPLFRQARALQLFVNPGEMLFTPSSWFHRVESLEPALSLTFAVIEADDPLGRPPRKRPSET